MQNSKVQVKSEKEEWRVKAKELLPEVSLKKISPDTIYGFLFAMPRVEEAWNAKNLNLTKRIFQFASWCFFQSNDRFIKNAIAVGFYEHLDNQASIEAFKEFGNIRIFQEVKVLLEDRIDKKILEEIEKTLREKEK